MAKCQLGVDLSNKYPHSLSIMTASALLTYLLANMLQKLHHGVDRANIAEVLHMPCKRFK